MGKEHTAMTEFLGRKDRFADFFNGCLFRGEQLINPEDLEIIKGESDFLMEDKEKHMREIHRYRDIIMRWNHNVYLVIFACELQSKVHYAMPIRKMLYDSLSYMDQAKNLWEVHPHDKKEQVSGAEYLSRFRKDDKLIPVITVVFYYGTEEWDGSIDLYGMFPDDELLQKEIVRKYVSNYDINLIDVGKIEQVEYFCTDLNEIFGLMKYRNDKDGLEKYMHEHGDVFCHVDGVTHQAIGAMLHSKELIKVIPANHEQGARYNMCKAIDDLIADGRIRGHMEGRMEGERIKLLSQIEKKRNKGYSVEEIADALEEDVEIIISLMEQKKIS